MQRIAFATMLIFAGAGSQMVCRRADPLPDVLTVGRPLPRGLADALRESGWEERVGRELGLWVSAARQQLVGIEDGRVAFIHACSTAAKGLGCEANSYQTPTGWHEIDERIGADAPPGAVFIERKFTGRVWTPDEPTEKDYVLTRIMWLRGLEPGVNAGPGVDSHDRYIYIHGTPAEDKLGTPASQGCVRMSNADVIRVFDATTRGTKVLITDW